MIASIEPLNAGFPLSDPSDPRHQYITALRHRFGEFLHRASISLLQQGGENSLDAVNGLVCCGFHLIDFSDFNPPRYVRLEHICWSMVIIETGELSGFIVQFSWSHWTFKLLHSV
jgi:proteasome activator subunit 4